MGRNRKLVGKAIADKLEITETFEELEKGVVIATSMFEKEFSIKVGGTA